MHFDVKMWFDIMMAILFLGFFVLSILSIRTILKQRDIQIFSRISRQTGLIEVLDVNLALIVIVILVIRQLYWYIPVVAVFAFFIMTTTRLQSGMTATGLYVGMTFIPWEEVKSYKIINDDINTLQLKFRVNNRRYIMRCNKEDRKDIDAILRKFRIQEQQTILNKEAQS